MSILGWFHSYWQCCWQLVLTTPMSLFSPISCHYYVCAHIVVYNISLAWNCPHSQVCVVSSGVNTCMSGFHLEILPERALPNSEILAWNKLLVANTVAHKVANSSRATYHAESKCSSPKWNPYMSCGYTYNWCCSMLQCHSIGFNSPYIKYMQTMVNNRVTNTLLTTLSTITLTITLLHRIFQCVILVLSVQLKNTTSVLYQLQSVGLFMYMYLCILLLLSC